MSFLKLREVPVGAALVVLVGVTYLVNPQFLTAQGIKDLLLNSTILVILAAGQALVIITRNVDLSVGSILGLTAYATGTLFATQPGIPIIAVFAICIALGAALGAINGLLVSVAKVPALVITLGTLYIYRGINNAWAGGKQYFAGDRPESFGALSVDTDPRRTADHADRAGHPGRRRALHVRRPLRTRPLRGGLRPHRGEPVRYSGGSAGSSPSSWSTVP